MIDVTINGTKKQVPANTKVVDIIENKNYDIIAVKINQKLHDLNYEVPTSCEIVPLDVSDLDASNIYQASLRFVVAMAAKRLYPKFNIQFNVSVCFSYFARFGKEKPVITQKEFKELEKEIHSIVSANYAIKKTILKKDDAIAVFKEEGMEDVVKLFKYCDEKEVPVFECEGFKDHYFYDLVPSTGYLKVFELRMYNPGFLIRYPRADHMGKVPAFVDDKEFRKTLKEANEWSHIASSDSIGDINEKIEEGKALEYINLCECRHNRLLVRLVDSIEKNIENIKLICVAGPSSSGKTTFTNRVRIELKSRGHEPLMISMDDFYKHESLVPKLENGKPDFEHIDALDLAFFDEVILKLSQGEAVQLPSWNFAEQKRTLSEPVKLLPNHPILIEGIHGLNDKIAPSIPDSDKFKIFICPLFQSNIDNHNPISLTDLRLMRRMIRDYMTRGVSCERTFYLWPGVRDGEFKWIYPNQCHADFIFNTEQDYEFNLYKKHIIPLLSKVSQDSEYYTKAQQLIKFLGFFKDITDNWIPCNSVIREFIGGSIFYTEDKI